MKQINDYAEQFKPELKGIWHTDETMLKSKKQAVWVWNTIDEQTKFLVASTVRVIIAQRLLRKICDGCKTSMDFTRSELLKHFSKDLLLKYFPEGESITTYHGTGCKLCHNTGYKGRLGVFEVLEVSQEIRKLIADAEVINKQAIKEGMQSMLDDALIKVQKGSTTIEEVIRVTKAESL